jgi:cutinase
MSVMTGVNDVVERLVAQDKACPKQMFALVGFSQGAMVMHGAASKIPAEIAMKKVMALVMFGDPGLGKAKVEPLPAALSQRIFENCAVGDPVGEICSLTPRH